MSDAMGPTAALEKAGAPAFRPTRIAWVDVARGVGMILVITGHAITKPTPPPILLGRWIYSFHMPLFFLISGLLIKGEVQSVPWREVLSKAARSLVLPYALFGAISYLAWLLVLRHFGNDAHSFVPVMYPLVGLLYGTFDSGLNVLDAPVWFFTTLFCTLVLQRCLPRGFLAQIIVVLMIFAAGVAYVKLSPRRLPWGLDLACLSLLFLYTGQQLRPWLLNLSAAARLKWLLAVPLLVTVQSICALSNERVDMARGLIGQPALFVIGAICGSLAILLIAPFLAKSLVCSRVLGSFIGKNTLIIFPMHLFCFSAVTAAITFIPAFRQVVFLDRFETLTVYVVLTCMGFVVILPVMKRLFPWLLPVRGPATPVPATES